MEHSIYDLVNYLKQTRRDTTITKYMNIISQVCKFGQRKGLIKALPNIPKFSRINEEVPPYFAKDIKQIRNQIMEDIDLMATTCPNLRKVNLVIHYKIQIMDTINTEVKKICI